MTRVRTHHEYVQRPVWDRLGADAFLLHHAALAYVNAHGTDGLLPKVKAKLLHSAVKTPSRQIQGLLAEEWWSEEDDEHYRVCEVQDDLRAGGGRGDEQPSADYVRREQDRARERKEAWKAKRNGEWNAVPNKGQNSSQGSAGQGRTVQDPEGSSPAPVPDDDCEHGVDRFASCMKCAKSQRQESA